MCLLYEPRPNASGRCESSCDRNFRVICLLNVCPRRRRRADVPSPKSSEHVIVRDGGPTMDGW